MILLNRYVFLSLIIFAGNLAQIVNAYNIHNIMFIFVAKPTESNSEENIIVQGNFIISTIIHIKYTESD